MNLLPNAAQSAVARIDALNQRFVQTAKNHHAQVSSILSGTKDDTGTTLLTQAQIQAAAGGRFDALPAFLAGIGSVLAVAIPAASLATPSPATSAAAPGVAASPAATV